MTGDVPRPRPRPRPAPAARPESPEADTARTRAARRQAERDAERSRRKRSKKPITLAAGALVVVALIAAGALVLANNNSSSPKHRANPSPTPTVTGAQLVDADRAGAFIAAATSDVAAVTTYDYRSLDDALSTGLAVTTGGYRTAYQKALTGQLAATARAKHVIQSFEVLKLGIGEINAAGTQAKVLVFGNEQVVDDTTGSRGDSTPVTLCATVDREGDRYLISALVADANAGLPPGGPGLGVAAEAARDELVNLLSYRRAQFGADLQRARAGAGSRLSQQIQQNAAATKAAMIKGKYDLRGTATAIAVESSDDASATLLLAGNSARLSDAGAVIGTSPVRYEVTVTRTAGTWTVNQAVAVTGD